jgi:hypothetical protein
MTVGISDLGILCWRVDTISQLPDGTPVRIKTFDVSQRE